MVTDTAVKTLTRTASACNAHEYPCADPHADADDYNHAIDDADAHADRDGNVGCGGDSAE